MKLNDPDTEPDELWIPEPMTDAERAEVAQAIRKAAMTGRCDVIPVEEDGDEVFTPMPTTCGRMVPIPPSTKHVRNCGGHIVPRDGFMVCDKCGASYGAAKWK